MKTTKKLVKTDKYVVEVDVNWIYPEEDRSEQCMTAESVKLLKEVEERANNDEFYWLTKNGFNVYKNINAPLTPVQVADAQHAVYKWITTCKENGAKYEPVDVDHSALLRRLLSGGELHKNPPPLRFSYPAWEMVEDEIIPIIEMFEGSGVNPGKVVVDQHGEYVWADKEKQIIKHERLGILYQYYEEEVTGKRLNKDNKPEDYKYIGKFLKRLNNG